LKTKHKVAVQVEDSVVFEGAEDLRHAALAVLPSHDIELACELVVVVSDDAALRELNRRFRGIDAPTDVLSFINDNRGPYTGLSGNFPQQLGDIVISIDRARMQADAAKATLLDEMQLLVIHGTLHLLGYDHEAEDEKSKMWTSQRLILQALDIDAALPE